MTETRWEDGAAGEDGACSIGCDGLAFLGAAGLALLVEAIYGSVPGNFRAILKIFSICPDWSGYKAGNGAGRREFRAGRKKICTISTMQLKES